MPCAVYFLNMVGFSQAHELQLELVRRRLQGEITDTLLLLEHPPTITLGRSGKTDNLLVSPARLKAEGIAFYRTDRGGDVTYHGPGQLVGYPILSLRESRMSVHRYVYSLEEVLIRTLGGFGIKAGRDHGHAGVWVGREGVAAIGLGVKHGVSMHGFALNINPRLEHFALIRPCGFADRRATSMARLVGDGLAVNTVAEALVGHFSRVFGLRTEWGAGEWLLKV